MEKRGITRVMAQFMWRRWRFFPRTRVFPICMIALLFALGGCPSKTYQNERPLDLPFHKIFPSDFDTVWQAVVEVLDLYSIELGRRDTGEIQTGWILARFNTSLYEYPTKEPFLEEVRYRLKIKLSKGFVTETKKQAVRVQVLKELADYKNILTDWQRIPTDSIEESVLLYRIGQRINVIEAIQMERRRKNREAQGASQQKVNR